MFLVACVIAAVSCEEEGLTGDQFLISIAEPDGGQDFFYNAEERIVLIDLFSNFEDEKTITGRIELGYEGGKVTQIVTKLTPGIIDETQIVYDDESRISRVESTSEILQFDYASAEYVQIEITSKLESKIDRIEKWYFDSEDRIVKTESQNTQTNSIETVEYSYTSGTNLLNNLKFSSIAYKLIYGSQVFLAQEVKRTVRNQEGDEIFKSQHFYEPTIGKSGLPVAITERFLDEKNTMVVADEYFMQWGGLLEE